MKFAVNTTNFDNGFCLIDCYRYHFIYIMSDKFAVLEGYPKDGPEVPERTKVERAKDRHESGTGRKDKVKRGGRGPSNWGNPEDDLKHPEDFEPQEENLEEEEEED